LSVGTITDNIKEDIKSRCDIVDVISEHVPLKQQGKNFIGLCPFHDDSKPSFYVSRERQIFKCFACNSAGDIFTFVMKYQKMTYPETVKSLAARCGIALSEASPEEKASTQLKDDIKNLNKFAVDYYHKLLLNSPAGNTALTYLKKRGIEDITITNFKLGFSLSSWDDFLKASKKSGFSPQTIMQGGFILEGKNQGNHYDRFRGRIMFPIFDTKGEPIAFGGRILEAKESDAKYINSPETPLYNKSRTLYNLNLAQRAIQKEGRTVLVEGYMDAIACFQANVHNVIASLGTSLTETHVKLLKRYTEEVVIAYDSDKAGADATSRGMNLLVKGDFRVRVLTIPSGKDPDDFIRENGSEAFSKILLASADLVEYKIDRIQKQSGIDNADGKKQAVNDLVITLASMSNQVERSEYVKKCAERLDVEEDYIWQLLNKQGAGRHIERSTQPTIKPSTKKSAKESVEQLLIECLIQYPQFISQSQLQLTKEDFSNACHTELIELLWDMADKNGGGVELGDLINRCTSKESRDIVSGLIMKKRQSEEDTQFNGEVQFNACMNKMTEFHKREVKRSVRKESAEDKIAKARRLMELRRGNTTIY
jgi:DNA primase